jgi:hypothetical protein
LAIKPPQQRSLSLAEIDHFGRIVDRWKKKGGNRQNKRWGPRLGETEFAASVVPSIGESVVCVSMTERHPTLNPAVNQNNNEKV